MGDEAETDRATRTPVVLPPRRSVMTAQWCYHWALWLFLVGLVAAQFSCAFWDSSTRRDVSVAGQLPSHGLHDVFVDDAVDPEPYADRCVVCVLDGGRQYQPMRLSKAVARSADTQLEDPSSIHAYRIVRRAAQGRTVSTDASARYATTCGLIARTLDAIVDSCRALGYNVTDDYVRVVNGLDTSAAIIGLTDSLPVVIESLADESTTVRYIVPGYNGTACVVRLMGAYETPTATSGMILRGVDRAVYEQTTLAFLKSDNASAVAGTWKNGWFEEAASGSKWHSDVISTDSDPLGDVYGVRSRIFDMERNTELVMVSSPTTWPVQRTWGAIASTADTLLWFHSLTISNGSRFGIYRYEASQLHVARTTYTLETLLVNLSIAWVLLRWAACMIALQRGFRRGSLATWHAASLGSSVACMRGFHLLPLVLLVRLKAIFGVFWTVGIWYSGDQRAASEAWFVMYPSIAELVLLQFSVMNTVAKMLRRRVSDVMLGPSLAIFCLLHLVRVFVFDEPLTTSVSSAEMASLPLSAMFSPLVVLRLNGHVTWLVYVKLAVVAANWLPLLLCSQRNALLRQRALAHTACTLERALALRVTNLGGFGPMEIYVHEPAKPHDSSAAAASDQAASALMPTLTLAPLEHLRMGYVLLGGRFILSFNDFFLLLLLAPWRRRAFPPNFRLVVFTAKQASPSDHAAAAALEIQAQPELVRLNDPRLQSVALLDIAASAMY